LNGVGRRIPAPIFADWSTRFTAQNPGIVVKYEAINATEGVKQVIAGTADFGDTDMPISKAELEKKGLAEWHLLNGILIIKQSVTALFRYQNASEVVMRNRIK